LGHELHHDGESHDLAVLLSPLELGVLEELGQAGTVQHSVIREGFQDGILGDYINAGRGHHRHRADRRSHFAGQGQGARLMVKYNKKDNALNK